MAIRCYPQRSTCTIWLKLHLNPKIIWYLQGLFTSFKNWEYYGKRPGALTTKPYVLFMRHQQSGLYSCLYMFHIEKNKVPVIFGTKLIFWYLIIFFSILQSSSRDTCIFYIIIIYKIYCNIFFNFLFLAYKIYLKCLETKDNVARKIVNIIMISFQIIIEKWEDHYFQKS